MKVSLPDAYMGNRRIHILTYVIPPPHSSRSPAATMRVQAANAEPNKKGKLTRIFVSRKQILLQTAPMLNPPYSLIFTAPARTLTTPS